MSGETSVESADKSKVTIIMNMAHAARLDNLPGAVHQSGLAMVDAVGRVSFFPLTFPQIQNEMLRNRRRKRVHKGKQGGVFVWRWWRASGGLGRDVAFFCAAGGTGSTMSGIRLQKKLAARCTQGSAARILRAAPIFLFRKKKQRQV